jgi:hypothetical protein
MKAAKRASQIKGFMRFSFFKQALKASAFLLSVILFTSLMPLAHGTTIGTLVLTESSSMQLTETLNGVPIGNWNSSGANTWQWVNTDPNSYGGFVGSTTLVFLDPLNPGRYDVFLANSFFSDYTAAQVNNTFGAVDYPSNPALATDYLPFTQTGAQIIVPFSQGLFEAVNITVQGVPDGGSTAGLLVLAGAAIVVLRKQFGAAGCRPF